MLFCVFGFSCLVVFAVVEGTAGEKFGALPQARSIEIGTGLVTDDV